MPFGEVNCDKLELASSTNEIFSLSQIIGPAEAVIVIFVPYCFGDRTDNSIEALILEVNKRLEEFNSSDLRVICVTREPPCTVRQWRSDRGLALQVYSDPSLSVSNAVVGSFDLSLYLQATKGVQLGACFVSMPGVAVIAGTGKILYKYIAISPESVEITAEDLLRLSGTS
eukprot:gene9953-11003_t